MGSHLAKPLEIEHRWFVIDAHGKALGRLATKVASILRGKHQRTFTPHVDTGDFVVVLNASKIKLTGNKLDDKYSYSHSTYPGGFRARPYREVLATHPERIIQKAVRGMLPKTPLGRRMLGKLKVYAGSTHPHAAQKPQALSL